MGMGGGGEKYLQGLCAGNRAAGQDPGRLLRCLAGRGIHSGRWDCEGRVAPKAALDRSDEDIKVKEIA